MSLPPSGPPPAPPEINLSFEDAGPPAAPPPAPPRRSLRANTIIVMLGTLGSRLSGILRQQIINLFDERLTDAFTVAVKVPNLLRELLAEGALVNSFIPVYKSLDTQGRRALAQTFSGVMIAVNLLLMALGILAAPLVVDLLLSGTSNVDREVAVYMTRLVMPFLMLISLSSVAMGLLNADEHFRESSFAPIAFNLASIAALALLPDTATWLGVGWLLGGVAQLVVQLPALHRFGLLPIPRLGGHPALGRVLRQMAPFTLTAGARQLLNVYVTSLLTNVQQFPKGTATGYANAEALFTMVNGLFVVSPVLAVFPRFSQAAADRDWALFRQLTAQTIRTTTFLAAPMSALLVALAPYAVSLMNLKVPAGPEALDKFAAGSGILTGWALALVPWALVTVLLRTFYARERTREAVTVSALGFVLEVALYRLLVPPLGLSGFGLSTTISGVLMTGALLYLYRRDVGFPGREVAGHLARVLPLAALAGAAAWLLAKVLPAPGFFVQGVLGLAVAGGAGLALYLAGALALKLPEVGAVTRRLRR
ncbi:murein biosynthesis integral membrane protein MurJ [Deinococcus multiflagellatus]|uniref:Murein biosynthesis integral membrane protein MurJ n=1 Tax=Deinococcus multiflagellatus TaxID=1656887 RepID=A0ABW1ZMB9_9DEIO|nr:murein biosynthesis integral membrane protein MurJ [Deinococcus multiflagellatus]MBZ9713267.1 murein biosynthesis integral membrane protein MurJ [Deinococcus multiflagellatus]